MTLEDIRKAADLDNELRIKLEKALAEMNYRGLGFAVYRSPLDDRPLDFIYHGTFTFPSRGVSAGKLQDIAFFVVSAKMIFKEVFGYDYLVDVDAADCDTMVDGRFNFWNPKAGARYHFGSPLVIGQNYIDLVNFVEPQNALELIIRNNIRKVRRGLLFYEHNTNVGNFGGIMDDFNMAVNSSFEILGLLRAISNGDYSPSLPALVPNLSLLNILDAKSIYNVDGLTPDDSKFMDIWYAAVSSVELCVRDYIKQFPQDKVIRDRD